MASDGNKKGIGADEPNKDIGRQNNTDDADAMNVDWMIMSDFSTRIGTNLSPSQPNPTSKPATTKKPISAPATDDLEDDLEDIEWLQSLGLDEPVESHSKLNISVTGSNKPTALNQSVNQSGANPASSNIENIDWLIVSDLKTRIDDSGVKGNANPPVTTVQPVNSSTNPVVESLEDDFSFLDEPELADLDSLGFDTEGTEEQIFGDLTNEFSNSYDNEPIQDADLSDMDFLGELLQESNDIPETLSNDVLNDLREIEELDTIGRSFIYENEAANKSSEEVTGDFFGSEFDNQVAATLDKAELPLDYNFEDELNDQYDQFDISELEISDRALSQAEIGDFQENDLHGFVNESFGESLESLEESLNDATDSQSEESLELQPDNLADEILDQDIYQDIDQESHQDPELLEQVIADSDVVDDWQVSSSDIDDFAVSIESNLDSNLDIDDGIWSSDRGISPEASSSSDFADAFVDVFADSWQPLNADVSLDDGVWHSSDSPDAVDLSDTVINNAFDHSFDTDDGANTAAIAGLDFQEGLANDLVDHSSTNNFTTDFAEAALTNTAEFADVVEAGDRQDFVDENLDPNLEVNFEQNLASEIAQPTLDGNNFEYSDQDLEAIIDSEIGTDWQNNFEIDANLGTDADWQNNLEADAADLGADWQDNLEVDAADLSANWQDNLEADAADLGVDWQDNLEADAADLSADWQDNLENDAADLGADADWQNNFDGSEPSETQDYWQDNLEAESVNWENISELEQNLEQNLEYNPDPALAQELEQNWQSQDDLNYWMDDPALDNAPIEAIAPDVNAYDNAYGDRSDIESAQDSIDEYQDEILNQQEQNLENSFDLEIANSIENSTENSLEDNLETILDEDFDLADFDEESLPIVPSIYPSNVTTTLTPLHKDSSTVSAVSAEPINNEVDRELQTKIEPIENVEFSNNANLDVNLLEPIDIAIPVPSAPPPSSFTAPPFIDSFDPFEEEIANDLLRDRQASEADFMQEALHNDLLGNDLLGDDLLPDAMNHDYLDSFDLDNLDTQLPDDYSIAPPAISTGLNSPQITNAPPPPVTPLPTPPPVVNPVDFYEEPSLSHTSVTPLSPPSLPPLPPKRSSAQAPTPMPLPMAPRKPMEMNVPAIDSFDRFHESAGRSPNPRSARDIDSVDQGWSDLLDADTVLSGVLRSPISGDTSIGQRQRGGNARAMPDTGSSRQSPPPQDRGRNQRKKSSTGGLPSFDELGLEVHDDNTDWSGLLDSGELSDSITTISNANTPVSSRRVPPRSEMTIGGETREIPRDRRPAMPNFNEPMRSRMDIPNDPMDFNRFTEDNYDPYQPVTPEPAATPQKPKITLPSISLEAMWQDYLKYPVIGLGAIGGAFLLYSLVSRPVFDLGLRWGIFKNAKGMDFTKADFTGAKLENVDFSEAVLTNAKFPDANLSGANLQSAKLDGADFKNANMSGARLINASVIWANFANAQMNLVDLAGADITRSNFIGAKMNSANLKGTKIGAQGTEKATKLSPTVLLAWQIVNEPREGRNLRDQDLSALNLSFSTLKRANLTNTKLNFTDMTGTDLSGANLSGAQVNGANWNGAKLNGVNLTNVRFDKTRLPRTDEQTICPNNRPGPCNF